MDKLIPVIQDTPLTTKVAESVSGWYDTESTVGVYTPSEVASLNAQGWIVFSTITRGATTTYFLYRRIIKPEKVLADLVSSYTTAYNEGRQLNDQRYDDIIVIYLQILGQTEDSYNTLETADTTYETAIEAIFTAITSDFTSYDTDVTGDLDDWGTAQLAEANARFDAELGKAQQSLIDRGMNNATVWTVVSAGVERERTRALNVVNDTIEQRQLELKHKVYDEQKAVRSRLLEARERLRNFLHGAKDKQIAIRNQATEALARAIERRTDGYPDLSQIGALAASLGAGSAEAFSP